MASFIAKQLIGDQLGSVKEAVGDKKEKEEPVDPEAEQEAQQQREEEERKRKEKHMKMEKEREKMRQGIRDKYGLKKPEKIESDPLVDGRIGRKRKTPEEIAQEQSYDSDEELQKKISNICCCLNFL